MSYVVFPENYCINAEEIRRIRRERGETQSEFAKRIGVEPALLNKWELGLVPCDGTLAMAIANQEREADDWEIGRKLDVMRRELEFLTRHVKVVELERSNLKSENDKLRELVAKAEGQVNCKFCGNALDKDQSCNRHDDVVYTSTGPVPALAFMVRTPMEPMPPKAFIILLKSLQEIRPNAYLNFRVKLVDFDIEKQPEGPNDPEGWEAWLTDDEDGYMRWSPFGRGESGERAMGALIRELERMYKP